MPITNISILRMNICLLFMLFILTFITITSSHEKQGKKSDLRSKTLSHPNSLQKVKVSRSRRMKKLKQNAKEEVQVNGNAVSGIKPSSKSADRNSPKKFRKKRLRKKNENKKPTSSNLVKKSGNRNGSRKIAKRKGRKKEISEVQKRQHKKRELRKDKDGGVDIMLNDRHPDTNVQKKNRRKKRRKYKAKVEPGIAKKPKAANQEQPYASSYVEALRLNLPFIPFSPPKGRQNENVKRQRGRKKNSSTPSDFVKESNKFKPKAENEFINSGKRKQEKQIQNSSEKVIKTAAMPTISPQMLHLSPTTQKVYETVTVIDSHLGILAKSRNPIFEKLGIRIVQPWENGERHVDDDGTVYIIDKMGTVFWGKNFGSADENLNEYRRSKKIIQEAKDRAQKEFERQAQGTTEDPMEVSFEEDPLANCKPLNNGMCKRFRDRPSKCIKRYRDGNCEQGISWYNLIDMKTGKKGSLKSQIVTFPSPYNYKEI